MTPRSQIVVLTGVRGSGKTIACARLAEEWRSEGYDVAGLISAGQFAAGRKIVIEVLDLRTQERRRLARRRKADQPVMQTRLETDTWIFDPATVEWGNRVLREAVPCDLLVVDELGPLEFQRGQGWLAAFDAIDSGAYQMAVVVVRPELIEMAQARWPAAQIVNMGNAPSKILEAKWHAATRPS